MKNNIYNDVVLILPTNSYECVVKMWNQYNDEWVTGIGIYDILTSRWEVGDNRGRMFPVRFWMKTPKLKIN